MIKLAVLPVALLLPAAALAQPVDQSLPAPPQVPAPAHLPLAAMRHQQPREGQVDERELETFGSREAQAQRQRQNEVDQLYGEIMRQSALPGPGQGR